MSENMIDDMQSAWDLSRRRGAPKFELSEHLASEQALLAHLGIGRAEHLFLNRHAGYRYHLKQVPKRRGGVRTLMIPDDRLKFFQQKLLRLLEPLYIVRAPVHGFVKGKSPITNAKVHAGRPFLLNVDLENFFGTVTRNRVEGVLRALGLNSDVVRLIGTLCVANNQLPQGAPTSPILANMICYRLDRELMQFAASHRLRYTRYADDLTFSGFVPPVGLFEAGIVPSSGLLGPAQLSAALRQIISGNVFWINPGKVRFSDRKARKEVTGLVVNEFANVRRNFVRNLRAGLYRTERLGPEAAQLEHAAKFGEDASLEQALRGQLEWIAQVRGKSFGAYRTLGGRFNALYPARPVPIDPTYEEVARRAVFVLEYGEAEQVSQGTAFLLEGVGLVTAHHVLETMDVPWADLFRAHEPTKKFKARPSSKQCSHRDLVILEHDLPEEEQAFLKPGTVPPRTREPILALGFPSFDHGDELSMRPGEIVARPTRHGVKYIEVDATLDNGLSGGPIVNDRYEVMGVIHWGGGDISRQFAINISEVIAFAQEPTAEVTATSI